MTFNKTNFGVHASGFVRGPPWPSSFMQVMKISTKTFVTQKRRPSEARSLVDLKLMLPTDAMLLHMLEHLKHGVSNMTSPAPASHCPRSSP